MLFFAFPNFHDSAIHTLVVGPWMEKVAIEMEMYKSDSNMHAKADHDARGARSTVEPLVLPQRTRLSSSSRELHDSLEELAMWLDLYLHNSLDAFAGPAHYSEETRTEAAMGMQTVYTQYSLHVENSNLVVVEVVAVGYGMHDLQKTAKDDLYILANETKLLVVVVVAAVVVNVDEQVDEVDESEAAWSS
jgi:hypothetical protein